MQSAPIPENEKERLESLHKLALLDTKPEERFDRITRTAIKVFKVPISTLTLVDATREWFKSCQGFPAHEGERAISFCGHALVTKKDVFVILDTTKDSRFADNPMVVGKPFIRFYAGIPLLSADGERVGVFCIKDIKPHNEFPENEEEIFKGLASWAELELNSHNLSLALSSRKKIEEKYTKHVKELEDSKKAILNVLEDLDVEKVNIDAAQKRIEVSEKKFKSLYESSRDAIMILEPPTWKFTSGNQAAIEMFRAKDEAEFILKTPGQLSPERQPDNQLSGEKAMKQIKMALEKGSNFFEWTHMKINGKSFPATVLLSKIEINGRGVLQATVRDITKEKEIDKAKTEFVSLASHQLLTPLSTVNWYTEMLLAGDAGKINAGQKEYLEAVYRGNQRMVELVDTLLNVSRLELGIFVVEPEPTDIADLAKSAIAEQKPQIDAKKLKFSFHTTDVPKINVDPKLLHMVFQNLLSNAVKYTPKGGSIEFSISLDKKKRHINIQVADTGYGIPKNQQDKIFTKLFRADNVRGKDTEGTGLGLYIAKLIMDHSGGKIWFSSPGGSPPKDGQAALGEESSENKGTTFYVSLPISGMQKKEGTKALG